MDQPQSRMCPQCRAFVPRDSSACPYCQADLPGTSESSSPDFRARSRPKADRIAGIIPAHAYVTFLMVILCTGFWLACVIFSTNNGKSDAWSTLDLRTLILFGAKWMPEMIPGGQWWRLLTAAFLHGSLMHIALNLLTLLVVGAHCEEIYGTTRYIAIYLFSSITGFWFSLALSPDTLSVGASAPLMGIVGALIAVAWIRRTKETLALRDFYVQLVIFSTAVNVLLPSLSALGVPMFRDIRVDHAAHLGGLVGGVLIALLAGLPSQQPSPVKETTWRVITTAMIFLTVFGVFRMYVFFDRLAQTQAYR